ncbi:hypothetical protein GQ42DRAFT_134936 [Ramicandelaber brevisporus]|nr:hypothetical protein GQ42DRAFT_134936 [Ramicandelaber brevisporus]
MEAILDFNQPLDLELFDRVVNVAYTSIGAERQAADRVVTAFKEHELAWTRTEQIYMNSKLTASRYLAVQIIEDTIKKRWRVLHTSDRDGIKNFLLTSIFQRSTSGPKRKDDGSLINKLNVSLVALVKEEWPHNWPDFIPELIRSCHGSLEICGNNITILKMLSEDVFEFGSETMTQTKANALKEQLCKEFAEIFTLFIEVLERVVDTTIINLTITTLQRYISWVPLAFIFNTTLVEQMAKRFLTNPSHRNQALKCLTDIAALTNSAEGALKAPVLFALTLEGIAGVVEPTFDFSSMYETSNPSDQQFIHDVAIFLTNILTVHIHTLEDQLSPTYMVGAHTYLLNFTRINSQDIFAICLDYWVAMTSDLAKDLRTARAMAAAGSGGGASLSDSLFAFSSGLTSTATGSDPNSGPGAGRRRVYADIMSGLRVCMIDCMVRPKEVIVDEDENGEVVRIQATNTVNTAQYKYIKDSLINLTIIDQGDMERIMGEQLTEQVSQRSYTHAKLNKLCWSIGAITGTFEPEVEKKFLVVVIKDLLHLCERIRGKANKAIVATNIMYVVGQYPRFLKSHWKFLKTVANKLFEFMHEEHEGVKEMACETFETISSKCKAKFCTQQPEEDHTFIEEIIIRINSITSDLDHKSLCMFISSLGNLIGNFQNENARPQLMQQLMTPHNTKLLDSMRQLNSLNNDLINNQGLAQDLQKLLKINTAACERSGQAYYFQLGGLFNDLMGLYRCCTTNAKQAYSVHGDIAPKMPAVRAVLAIKNQIIDLVHKFILTATDLPAVNVQVVIPFFQVMLVDYAESHADMRSEQVLVATSAIMQKMGPLLTETIPSILSVVFGPTLIMIGQNEIDYPQHRELFYKLIGDMVQHCFGALTKFPPNDMDQFIRAIAFGFGHHQNNIIEPALQSMLDLINGMAIGTTEPEISQSFFKHHYMTILTSVVKVLTDGEHAGGFRQQCLILSRLVHFITSGLITIPLYDLQALSNRTFIEYYLFGTLKNAFTDAHPKHVEVFVRGLFEFKDSIEQFRHHVRDFLIQLKQQWGGETDVFTQMREKELAERINSSQSPTAQPPQIGNNGAPQLSIAGVRTGSNDGDDDEVA